MGICLGMQLFFEESSENYNTNGLGMIRGKVKKLSTNENDILPNVGWFETVIKPNKTFDYLKDFKGMIIIAIILMIIEGSTFGLLSYFIEIPGM